MKRTVFEIVTQQIIDKLEDGVIPWKQKWLSTFPMNFITKREYGGLNCLLLQLSEFKSPYWLTFRQCSEKGGNIRRGEKSTIVCFWKPLNRDKAELDENAKEKTSPKFVFRYYRVFNLEQCDGIESENTNPIVCPVHECEEIFDGYTDCPEISWDSTNAAYSPKEDKVLMPSRDKFESPESVYSVLFHELAHSTGHKKRLNRKGVAEYDKFGSDQYSNEELVAEFCSAFLCGRSGIAPATVDNAASYIDHWKKKLSEDPRLLSHAASQAQKAANYILGNHETKS